MEIYCADLDIDTLKQFNERTGLKPNVLFSYKYIGNKKNTKDIGNKKNTKDEFNFKSVISQYKPITNKMMLDSGGFSTKNLDEDDQDCLALENRFYDLIEHNVEYLDEFFTCVFAFDKISDNYINYEKNFDRYDLQYSKYPKIVPIVHNITDNSKEIEKYSVYNPHTIAIGFSPEKTNIKYLEPATKKIRQVCKSHLLGITAVGILSEVETDTCDSTSWLQDSKHGIIRYFYVENGKILSESVYFPKYHGAVKGGTVSFDEFKFKDQLIEIAESKFRLNKENFYDLYDGILYRKLMNIYFTMEYEKLLTEYYITSKVIVNN